MTVRIKIQHAGGRDDPAVTVTDYNGTKTLHPGQADEFFVYDGSAPISIEEVVTTVIEEPAADPVEEPAADPVEEPVDVTVPG